jgi:putative DNA primase/helicase
MADTKDAARGKWENILAHFGVSSEYLRKGIDTECPNCGGKDRYRFTDRKGDGDYYCRGCGPGNGFKLLMLLNGWEFAECAKEVDAVVGNIPVGSGYSSEARNPEKIRSALRKVWDGASPGQGIVRAYLMKRGLSVFPSCLRGHPNLEYYTPEGELKGKYPAMLAQVLGADKKPQSIHRTYIADVDPRKKMMKPIDTVAGAAVRLFPATDTVAVTEGIETAIAVFELTGFPTWATTSAGGLETFQVPEGIQNVAIYGDNDENFVGQVAAYKLACRLVREGKTVTVTIPLNVNTDWLDVLNERNKKPL